jgi:hypothetical protein
MSRKRKPDRPPILGLSWRRFDPRWISPLSLSFRAIRVQLVAGVVSELSGRRAATFIYKDTAGRYTTLFLMPGAGIVVPEGDRMPIETFKPHYRTASGRSLILWKHRDLAWLLVSDLDKTEVPAMYLKVRKAANPPSAVLPSGIS